VDWTDEPTAPDPPEVAAMDRHRQHHDDHHDDDEHDDESWHRACRDGALVRTGRGRRRARRPRYRRLAAS
jgi:hypothetical protein